MMWTKYVIPLVYLLPNAIRKTQSKQDESERKIKYVWIRLKTLAKNLVRTMYEMVRGLYWFPRDF